jgi:hypothetical protein
MNDPTKTIVQTASQPRQQELILQEFRLSASPDRLTLANVEFIEGDEAVEILAEHAIAQCQKSANFVGVGAQRLLERYAFVSAGAWAVWGTTLEGGRGTVPIVKPREPRIDFDRQRPIKYETPSKAEALPILPFVDYETAALVYQRYKATPLTGETFWQVVHRCDLPIAITEGLKKALALLAHGLPAIAMRGITQWHKKGSNELHDLIATFATPKRLLYVILDQDVKERTRRDVQLQALKLGTALELRGSLPSLPQWDSKLGKGIDDALFSQGNNALAWFDNLITNAPTLKAYRRDERTQKCLETIARLNQLSYPVERTTAGEYLPALPALQPGAIHVLNASMNAGKTTRIGEDWVQWAIAQDWNVLVLAPLNSLGQQTATGWQLPHIHDYGTATDQQEALWRAVSASHGLTLCPDSLPRLPAWFFERPLLLVLDEANQVLDHITEGNTLGDRYAAVNEQYAAILQQASAIVLSEDGITNRTMDHTKALSSATTVRVFSHQKQGIPWDCLRYRGQSSGFRAKCLQAVGNGQPLLFLTSSQQEGKRLERAIAKRYPDKKVVRIDSETNQGGQFTAFFEQPDTWLETQQPDVLILSPSAKSGISIQGGVAVESTSFRQVWAYFPTLTTDTHMQMLGRFRPSVPRFIFCPDFALSSGDEAFQNPRAIRRRLQANARVLAGAYGLNELLAAADDRAERLATIETATLDYLTASLAVAGAQKAILGVSLVQRLEAAGHHVTEETLAQDKDMTTFWKAIQEELWREEAAAIATKEVEPAHHTPAWAHNALDSLECSLETRTLARKVLYRDEFPGVLFDDAEECYQALCQDYGKLRQGVRAQAKAENLEGTKEAERSAVEAILKGNLRALHRLPKAYAQALLRSKSGVLDLLDGTHYSNTDPRATAVKKFALQYAKEIFYYLRLTIKADQTPVEICHKLLAQLGLESDRSNRPGAIVRVGRPGKRGEQKDRVYAINREFNPLRVRLLEAARRKLSESVSTTRIKENRPLRVMDTEPNPPPNQDVAGGSLVRWGSRLGEWVIDSVDGDTAKVRAAAGWANGMSWDAKLSDLRTIA